MKLRFEGGQQMAAALEKLSKRTSARVKLDALTEAAEPMRKSMERYAPYAPGKPGDLRDHMIVANSRGLDAKESAVAVGPAKPFFYGSFQEFGTKHHGAQPFARPAFDENVDKSLKILADVLWLSLTGHGVGAGLGERPSPAESLPDLGLT